MNKKTLSNPLAVKNASFTLLRSSGLTSECCHNKKIKAAAIPIKKNIPSESMNNITNKMIIMKR